jgi:hypothetical protein
MSELVTDGMVTRGALEARAWGVVSKHGEWTDSEAQQQCARDILEAVAPAIAAKALKDAADELRRLDDGRTGGYYEAGRHIIQRLDARADLIAAMADGAHDYGDPT